MSVLVPRTTLPTHNHNSGTETRHNAPTTNAPLVHDTCYPTQHRMDARRRGIAETKLLVERRRRRGRRRQSTNGNVLAALFVSACPALIVVAAAASLAGSHGQRGQRGRVRTPQPPHASPVGACAQRRGLFGCRAGGDRGGDGGGGAARRRGRQRERGGRRARGGRRGWRRGGRLVWSGCGSGLRRDGSGTAGDGGSRGGALAERRRRTVEGEGAERQRRTGLGRAGGRKAHIVRAGNM